MARSRLPSARARCPRFVVASATVALTSLLTACGGDSSGPGPSPTLSITGYSGTLTWVGATVQLTASSSSGSAGSVQWSTSDGGVASVGASGLVTAVGPGTATISAQAGGATGSTSVAVDPAPASLVAGSGDTQSGTVGAALQSTFSVEVRDQGGTPIPDETVTFQASHEGSSSPSSSTTDAQGRAQTTWTLGTRAGEQTLTASSGGTSVAFSAEAAPGAPAILVAEAGNGQVGLAGEPLPDPIAVLVTDQYGNGVPDVSVDFTVPPGGGSVSSSEATSDAQGLASVVWTLDRYAGERSITAEVADLGSATFLATGMPNGVVSGVASGVELWTSPPPAPPAGAPWSTKFAQLAGLRALAVAPAAGSAGAVPGLPVRELLVTLAKPDHPAFFRAASTTATADAQAAALVDISRTLPGAGAFRVEGASPVVRTVRVAVAEGHDPAALAASLRADPRVENVEPNSLQFAHRAPRAGDVPAARGAGSGRRPADPVRVPGVSDDLLYPWQAWHYQSVGLHNAWKFTRGTSDIVVAVVDDGIRFDHPDIAAALLPHGFDFVQDGDIPRCSGGTIGNAGDGDGPDPDPTIPVMYGFNQQVTCVATLGGAGGHGLHVAGTIAAQDGNGGGVGVAPGVGILPVRVLAPHGGGSLYDVGQGILYAAGLPADGGTYGTVQAPYGAHVINLSLGGSTASAFQEAVVQAAADAGSLVIASSGNAGNSLPNYPAAYPGAVSVAAVGPSWSRTGYSSYHATVELAAPGGASAEAGDPAHGVISTIWDFDASAPSWDAWDGTSMAAPHASGVAALLFSQDPSRSAADVRALLAGHARDLGSVGRDPFYGYGLIDAVASLSEGEGVPGSTWVQLHDALTGDPVAHTVAGAGGEFSLGGLADGEYFLYAGKDGFDDGIFAVPGQFWSAYGGGAAPDPITVDGAGDQTRSFSFGYAFESEPNDATGSTNRLMVGAYVEGLLDGGGDADLYRIVVGQAGTYVFETYGVFGACGFALVPDTVLDLLDAGGALVTSGDDIDGGAFRFCSRVEATLQPGTYYLRVEAYGGTGSGGLYGLASGRL